LERRGGFSQYEIWVYLGKMSIQHTVNALHQSFASLSQEQQKYADIFLRDVQRGDVTPEQGKTFRDYISEYQSHAKNAQMMAVAEQFALNEDEFIQKLNKLMNTHVTSANVNAFGRFDDLKIVWIKQRQKPILKILKAAALPYLKSI